MFISRVEVPWEVARNPYEIHRRLWRLFPGQIAETRRQADESRQGFLFRIESQPTGRPTRLLMQSRIPPVKADGLTLIGSRQFLPVPREGQRLAFILTANPVKTITDELSASKPGKLSGKCRVPLIKEQDQRDWLTRKLAGVTEVEHADVLPHPPLYFRKGGHPGKLVTCTFEGVLRVTTPDKLLALLENGVGAGKGFGCGLLLVRPA